MSEAPFTTPQRSELFPGSSTRLTQFAYRDSEPDTKPKVAISVLWGGQPPHLPLSMLAPEHSRPYQSTEERVYTNPFFDVLIPAKSTDVLSNPYVRSFVNSILDSCLPDPTRGRHTVEDASREVSGLIKSAGANEHFSVRSVSPQVIVDLYRRGEIVSLGTLTPSTPATERHSAVSASRPFILSDTRFLDNIDIMGDTPTVGVHAGEEGKLSVFSNAPLEESRFADTRAAIQSAALGMSHLSKPDRQRYLRDLAEQSNANATLGCAVQVLSDEQCRALNNIRQYGVEKPGPSAVDWRVFDPLLGLGPMGGSM